MRHARMGLFAVVGFSLILFAWACNGDDTTDTPPGGEDASDAVTDVEPDGEGGDVGDTVVDAADTTGGGDDADDGGGGGDDADDGGGGGDDVDGGGGGMDADGGADGDTCVPTDGGTEICDGRDNDCDGQTDECCKTFYKDDDDDSYGEAADKVEACGKPKNHADQKGDCDDLDSSINPGADEKCNGVDDDCDGQTDEAGETTYYKDVDGDGYGDPSTSKKSCVQPNNFVENDGDCDDMDAAKNPGQNEICGDGKDNDCDGNTDEQCSSTCYLDDDGDGYGESSDTGNCNQNNYVQQSGDCLDTDADVHPGQTQYFASTNKSGGWDYNCDGNAEKQRTSTTDYCRPGTGNMCTANKAWQGTSVPACGDQADYLTSCTKSGMGINFTCDANYKQRTQKCR